MAEDRSYWTKRRKLREKVSLHLEYIRRTGEGQSCTGLESAAHGCSSEVHKCTDSVEAQDHPQDQEGDGCDDNFNFDVFSKCTWSDSESSVHSETSEVIFDDAKLPSQLAKWAVESKIPHNTISSLLEILQEYHPSLPKCARALLNTPRHHEIKQVAGGSFYYFGVEFSLFKILSHLDTAAFSSGEPYISLQINIDGLPLFKSSNCQFWPILGRVSHPLQSEPFIIALYCGNHKPGNISEYLHDFVDEIKCIFENGVKVGEDTVKVHLSSFICDAPARSFVKQIKGHNSYYGCEKCSQKGVWMGKVTFPSVNAPLRTDSGFKSMAYEEHHIARSPLTDVGIGMVSQFPYDYMHMVCLGVMRKLIGLWVRGPVGNNCRVGGKVILEISNELLQFWKFLPSEFPRKCRTLAEVDRWKANEYRQFLLYSGPVALKNKLPDDKYKNFLDFFVGIYCLASPFFCKTHYQYAQELLCIFVQDFGKIYGSDMLVYNVHGLSHLAADVANFGPLDNFSAFPFENFLGKLKAMLRKPTHPIQQVVSRLHEEMNIYLPNESKTKVGVQAPEYEHVNGPLPENGDYIQFKKITHKTLKFSVHSGDNCVKVGSRIGLLRNILKRKDADNGSHILIVFEHFSSISAFFTSPLSSSDLGIYKVAHLAGKLDVVPISEISCKYVMLPYQNGYVVIPVIHQFNNP